MAKSADKMICPQCGVEMNHHCDKLVYPVGPQETGLVKNAQIDPVVDLVLDPLLGGVISEVISEFHTCPTCGSAACRNA